MAPDNTDFGEKWLDAQLRLRPSVSPEMVVKATRLFRLCGRNIAWDVARVLVLAAEKGCIEVVHKILLSHYHLVLQNQHEEIRGLVKNKDGVCLTDVTMRHIYREILWTNEKPRFVPSDKKE